MDIEENATRIARENAAENHLDPERYTISCGNIISDETLRQEIGSGYDVITANIVADVIKGMAPLFPGFLKRQRHPHSVRHHHRACRRGAGYGDCL